MEEAKELFKLPKKLGEYGGKEVVVNTGRYGPYVKWGEDFISLGRQTDPFEVDFDHAKEVIEAKKKADEPVGTYKGIPYTQGKGRFGPFLKYDKLYVNIHKRYDPEQLTTDQAHELIEAKIQKEANLYIQRWD